MMCAYNWQPGSQGRLVESWQRKGGLVMARDGGPHAELGGSKPRTGAVLVRRQLDSQVLRRRQQAEI